MGEKLNLKELEKKAWRSFFQDGLWDIYFGLLLLALGLSSFTTLINLPEPLNLIIILIPIYSIAILLLVLGKKYITTPRIGYIKFGTKRKKIKKKLALILGIQVIITCIMVIFTALGLFQYIQINSMIIMLIIGLLFVALPVGIIAYFWDFPRLYIYGLLGGLGFFIAELLNPIIGQPLDLFIPYVIISGSMFIVGSRYFIKFLKTYPKVV